MEIIAAKLIAYGQKDERWTAFGGVTRSLNSGESVRDIDVFVKLPEGAFELLKTEPSRDDWDALFNRGHCQERIIYRTACEIAMFLYAECRCRNIFITRADFDATYEMAIGYVHQVTFTTYEGMQSNADVVSLNYLAPRLADYDVNTLCYRNGRIETFLKDVEVSAIQKNLRKQRARKCYQRDATEDCEYHDKRFKKREEKMKARGYHTYSEEKYADYSELRVGHEDLELCDLDEIIARHNLPRKEVKLPEGYNYVGRTAVFIYLSTHYDYMPLPRDIEVFGSDIEKLQANLEFPTKRVGNTLHYEGGSITLHETLDFLFDIYFLQFKDNKFSSLSEDITFEQIRQNLQKSRARMLREEYVEDNFIAMLNFSSYH